MRLHVWRGDAAWLNASGEAHVLGMPDGVQEENYAVVV